MTTLTTVVYQTINNSNIGLHDLAQKLGKSYHSLASELSGQERYKLGCELLIPIMRMTENYDAMHYLASQLGGVFIRLPQVIHHDNQLHTSLITTIKEFSEFATESSEGIIDGIITKAEFEKMEKESQEAISAISCFRLLSKQVHEKQYSTL